MGILFSSCFEHRPIPSVSISAIFGLGRLMDFFFTILIIFEVVFMDVQCKESLVCLLCDLGLPKDLCRHFMG